MKTYLRNFLLGIPLAAGALLTLISVVEVLEADTALLPGALLCGLLGIPLLFATVASICARPQNQ
jgi:hypothetical protein